MKNKTLYQKSTDVKSGKYTFRVESLEYHWEGGPRGGIEDMPGDFLEQKVMLIDCDNPSNIEAIAVENRILLGEFKTETSSEPKGYARLKHEDLIEKLKKDALYYTQNIRREVKKIL